MILIPSISPNLLRDIEQFNIMQKTTQQNLQLLIRYMVAKGYVVDLNPGHINIVYVEGMNGDFSLNPDKPDLWNDRRIVFTNTEAGELKLLGNWMATTEPGTTSTFSAAAMKLGGVARIKFGQYTAWRFGYHKKARWGNDHPALVQCAPIPVHRDANRDQRRTGDVVDLGRGINQHSTFLTYKPGTVSGHSAGCLVGAYWMEHMQFIQIVKSDPRYILDRFFVFTSAIIAGDDFQKFKTSTA